MSLVDLDTESERECLVEMRESMQRIVLKGSFDRILKLLNDNAANNRTFAILERHDGEPILLHMNNINAITPKAP